MRERTALLEMLVLQRSASQCRFVVTQGGNVHLVRSAAVAAEMEQVCFWLLCARGGRRDEGDGG